MIRWAISPRFAINTRLNMIQLSMQAAHNEGQTPTGAPVATVWSKGFT